MSSARKVYVGQEIERTEDFRFLTGRGTFVDDYEPAGLLHAAILRSSVPHGRIAEIDAAAALRMPGVYAVICARDIGSTIPRIPIRLAPIAGLEKYLQPVIAVDKVRYVGEPLAVIVADSRALAEDAAAKIAVTIEPLCSSARLAHGRDRRDFAVRGEWHQRRDPLHGRLRRYGCCLRRRRLHAPRVLSRPSPHRCADGDPRRGCRVGRRRGTTYRQRRDQSDVLQPSRARCDDANAGKRDRPDGARRRRRIWRARRILPGRFFDPLCRTQARPAHQMDRRPS